MIEIAVGVFQTIGGIVLGFGALVASLWLVCRAIDFSHYIYDRFMG